MRRDNNGLSAFLMGAIVGAAAVFFSDERNQKRLKATVDDWKSKAGDVREEGLKRVSSELEKTQARVDSERTKRR